MNPPLVSLIIPVYKVEEYLSRCIDSILNQEYKNFECILIDDGSPDKCPMICDEYAKNDKRIKVIHQENRGSAATRNVGLSKSIGKYILFIDSDDWVENNYVSSLVKKAEDTGAEIVGCDLYREYKDDSVVQVVNLSEMGDCCSSLLTGELPGWLWIKLFKRNLLDNNNISFLDGIDICEDTLFSLKAFFFAKKIAYVNFPLYHYNLQNQNSLTSILSDKKIQQIIRNDKEFEIFLLQNDVFEKYRYDLLRRKAFTKIWILRDCDELKNEYFRLYSDEDLHKVKGLSIFSKIFLLVLKFKLDFLSIIYIYLRKVI